MGTKVRGQIAFHLEPEQIQNRSASLLLHSISFLVQRWSGNKALAQSHKQPLRKCILDEAVESLFHDKTMPATVLTQKQPTPDKKCYRYRAQDILDCQVIKYQRNKKLPLAAFHKFVDNNRAPGWIKNKFVFSLWGSAAHSRELSIKRDPLPRKVSSHRAVTAACKQAASLGRALTNAGVRSRASRLGRGPEYSGRHQKEQVYGERRCESYGVLFSWCCRRKSLTRTIPETRWCLRRAVVFALLKTWKRRLNSGIIVLCFPCNTAF